MVKGNSRQVIVVHNPEQKLFEQAIFILRDDAVGSGITDEMLLKSADKILRSDGKQRKFSPVGGRRETLVSLAFCRGP